jgi:hypothetical protein
VRITPVAIGAVIAANDRIVDANWRIKLSGTKSWGVCRESIDIFWLYP